MHLVRVAVEVVEEPLRVERAAGSGDGDKDSQSARSMGYAAAARKRAAIPVYWLFLPGLGKTRQSCASFVRLEKKLSGA
jgi:hypothetical protein